jgi:hypothetical protein
LIALVGLDFLILENIWKVFSVVGFNKLPNSATNFLSALTPPSSEPEIVATSKTSSGFFSFCMIALMSWSLSVLKMKLRKVKKNHRRGNGFGDPAHPDPTDSHKMDVLNFSPSIHGHLTIEDKV